MEYFEELADLIEEEISTDFESFYQRLGNLDSEGTGEIVENYMDEIQNALPDEEQDIYMLIENIKTGLLFLCENLEDEKTRLKFAEELFRFREWYTNPDLVRLDDENASVLEAVTAERANKLLGTRSTYDFTDALDFELHDFEMSIGTFDKIDVVDDKRLN